MSDRRAEEERVLAAAFDTLSACRGEVGRAVRVIRREFLYLRGRVQVHYKRSGELAVEARALREELQRVRFSVVRNHQADALPLNGGRLGCWHRSRGSFELVIAVGACDICRTYTEAFLKEQDGG